MEGLSRTSSTRISLRNRRLDISEREYRFYDNHEFANIELSQVPVLSEICFSTFNYRMGKMILHITVNGKAQLCEKWSAAWTSHDYDARKIGPWVRFHMIATVEVRIWFKNAYIRKISSDASSEEVRSHFLVRRKGLGCISPEEESGPVICDHLYASIASTLSISLGSKYLHRDISTNV
jgi:hypothetical protein